MEGETDPDIEMQRKQQMAALEAALRQHLLGGAAVEDARRKAVEEQKGKARRLLCVFLVIEVYFFLQLMDMQPAFLLLKAGCRRLWQAVYMHYAMSVLIILFAGSYSLTLTWDTVQTQKTRLILSLLCSQVVGLYGLYHASSEEATTFAQASSANEALVSLIFQMVLVRSLPIVLWLSICVVGCVCACFCLTFCKKHARADVRAGAYEAHLGEYEGACGCCCDAFTGADQVTLPCSSGHRFHRTCIEHLV